MALIVLDASIVIAHLNSEDAHHAPASQALFARAGDDLRLPASAYAESLVGPLRRGFVDRARADIRELLVAIDPVTEATAEAAAGLQARFPSVRLPDALVVGHGDVLEADAVLTTDRSWRRLSGRVEVVG